MECISSFRLAEARYYALVLNYHQACSAESLGKIAHGFRLVTVRLRDVSINCEAEARRSVRAQEVPITEGKSATLSQFVEAPTPNSLLLLGWVSRPMVCCSLGITSEASIMPRAVIITAAIICIVGTWAQAQRPCAPIQFAHGSSSTTLQGMAPSDEPFTCYTLSTGSGQRAIIKLTKSNGDTAFNIAGLVDSRSNYSFMTEAKTYRIDVYQMSRDRRDASFTMQVSVK
jgi:hypothetical protein